MILRTTDMGGLETEKTIGGARRWFITLAVFSGLIGGGFALGAWVIAQQAREDIAALKLEHQREIERLQQAWGVKLQGAASAVNEAAQTAERAANTAQQAVDAAKTNPQHQPATKPKEPAK